VTGPRRYGPAVLKLTVLYSPPSDPDAFDEHYLSVHVPLAQAMPGLVRAETSKVVGTPDGSPPAFHRTADLYFEDGEAMQAAFASEHGRRTAKDATELAGRTGSTVTFLVAAVD